MRSAGVSDAQTDHQIRVYIYSFNILVYWEDYCIFVFINIYTKEIDDNNLHKMMMNKYMHFFNISASMNIISSVLLFRLSSMY